MISELTTLLLHKAPFTSSHNRSLLPLTSVTLTCILYLFFWIHSFKTIHKHHGDELLLHYVYEWALMSYSNLWECARAPGTPEVRTSKKLAWNSVHLPQRPSCICVGSDPTRYKGAPLRWADVGCRNSEGQQKTSQQQHSPWNCGQQAWWEDSNCTRAEGVIYLLCIVRSASSGAHKPRQQQWLPWGLTSLQTWSVWRQNTGLAHHTKHSGRQ